MIDNELRDRIKDANDIVDVIGEFVTLRKRGINYLGICPFHPDRTPSMTVSSSRQSFKCFVCGKGGDVIEFLQEHENMSFYEAVSWLGHRVGIEVPKPVFTDEEAAKIASARRSALQ